MIKLKTGFYEGKDVGYSQYFGENPQAYAQFGLKGHNGIDVPIPTGTRLYSVIDGTVVEQLNDINGYGIYVKIENNECGVLYAHLKSTPLKVGNTVKAGDLVGLSNNTGNSTGPHLHFAVHPKPRDRSNGYAGYIDPLGSQIEWVSSPTSPVDCVEVQKQLDYERKEKEKYKAEARQLREDLEKETKAKESAIEVNLNLIARQTELEKIYAEDGKRALEQRKADLETIKNREAIITGLELREDLLLDKIEELENSEKFTLSEFSWIERLQSLFI